MSLEHRWLQLVSGQARGPLAGAARAGLTALSGLYALGLRANLAVYRLGLKQYSHLCLPVISVGNLSVGGTGKSTSVRWLARALLARGLRPGVVLRGHRREGGAELLLASDGAGALAPVSECGDEATEVARALPQTPVAVGKSRERAISLLASRGVQVALLDDGYQYFRMARDLNIALLSARLDLSAARLLPRGVLREPWSHLARADQVWLTHTDLAPAEHLAALQALAARYAPGRPVVLTRHQPCDLAPLVLGGPPAPGQEHALGEAPPLSALQGRRVLAVSGLGCPESFEGSLAALGAHATPLRFADHHRYGGGDWELIAAAAARAGSEAVVTTEKDAVKLPPGAPLPVWVLRSELQIVGNGGAVEAALDALAASARGAG